MAADTMGVIKGRILYVNGGETWIGVGRTLLRSIDGGRTWSRRAVLPISSWRECLVFTRLGRRLGRVGFHNFLMTDSGSVLVFAHRHIFRLTQGARVLVKCAQLHGSRPLNVCSGNGMVCYGEYHPNPERSPVSIWAADPDGVAWEPVWRFDDVRHIHGVFYDPYSSGFWVTTGDNDDESWISVTYDHFRSLKQVVGGSQRYRVVQLLFTEDSVYFGTDAPNERNHLCRLERASGHVEELQEVNGPILYGYKLGRRLFFSSGVEPSKENRFPFAEVWGSADGSDWKLVASLRKDIWPKRSFRYGQIFFPNGPGDGKHLWCTPMGTERDQQTLKLLPTL